MTVDPRVRREPVARVHQVWVFPVKSMRGTSLPSTAVTAGGLAQDRAWAVVDGSGKTVSAAEEPGLRQVTAHIVGDGVVSIDVPGAPSGLIGPDADAALTSWLVRPLHLEHRGDAGFVDVAPVHLVSTFSMTHSAHAEECAACDIRAPRANLVIEFSVLDHEAGSTERDWIGRSVTLGEVTLEIGSRPDHCLGVYANVATTGQVRVGDAVALG